MSRRRELISKVSRYVRTRFKGDFRAAFDAFDGEGDGFVSAADVQQLLAAAGVGNALTRPFWVSGVMDALDADRDGRISWAEFQSAVRG